MVFGNRKKTRNYHNVYLVFSIPIGRLSREMYMLPVVGDNPVYLHKTIYQIMENMSPHTYANRSTKCLTYADTEDTCAYITFLFMSCMMNLPVVGSSVQTAYQTL